MQSEIRETVAATCLDVVEQLTFMFGEPFSPRDLPPPRGDALAATVRFHGDVEGSLSLVVPVGMTAEIAGNILGLEAEDVHPGAMLADALKEIVNIACGHVLLAIAGPDVDFTLEPAVHEKVDGEGWRERARSGAYEGLVLDDRPALLGWQLTREPR